MYKVLITTWIYSSDAEGNAMAGVAIHTEVVSFENSWDAKNAVDIVNKEDVARGDESEYGQKATLLFKV